MLREIKMPTILALENESFETRFGGGEVVSYGQWRGDESRDNGYRAGIFGENSGCLLLDEALRNLATVSELDLRRLSMLLLKFDERHVSN